jgi:hypothetical protein
MIHPGLAALKHWDREEYAPGYRARFSEIPDSDTHHCWRCGWEDADTEALESARIRKRWLKAGKTTLKTPGAISSIRGKRREPMVFRSKKNERSLGKRAGSQSISSWGYLRSENSSEEGTSASYVLSVLKSFPVLQQVRLEFRSDFFNIFNRPNRPNRTNLQSDPSNGNFSKATSAFNARYIRLVARLTF